MSNTPVFHMAITKLAAVNIPTAVAFYEQQLGFTRIFQTDDYAGIKRDAVELNLWQCDDKYIAEHTACRIEVEHIDALYAEYSARNLIHPNGALQVQPWGTKEFTVLDHDGNGLTFVEQEAQSR